MDRRLKRHARSTPGGFAPRWSSILLPALLLVGLLLATGVQAQENEGRTTPRRGERIQVLGQVLTGANTALPGVHVLFEATGPDFRLRTLTRGRKDAVVVPAITDGGGRFALDWAWVGGYDRFELAVAVPVIPDGLPSFQVLQRWDVTAPVIGGGPVEVALPMADGATSDWLLRFADGRASADETRTFQEVGLPERVEGPDAVLREVSWWYFEAGKVYRFRDGSLLQVIHFDPIAEP